MFTYCGRKAALNQSCVKVEVAVLGLMVRTVSVDRQTDPKRVYSVTTDGPQTCVQCDDRQAPQNGCTV